MTQGDKDLLLKDICARMPYQLKMDCGTVKPYHILQTIYIDVEDGHVDILDDVGLTYKLEDIKPYLRPMSSMTEEERIEYRQKQTNYEFGYFDTYDSIDWLNAHHFDYRHLIGNGLALESPEGMYKN